MPNAAGPPLVQPAAFLEEYMEVWKQTCDILDSYGVEYGSFVSLQMPQLARHENLYYDKRTGLLDR